MTSRASPARTARAPSSRCSRTSGTARALPTRPSRSTAAPTTTPSPRPASRPVASSPAPRSIKQPYQVALYGGTAGVAFDPCYHQLCDILANISDAGPRRAQRRRRPRHLDLRPDDFSGERNREGLALVGEAVRLEDRPTGSLTNPGPRTHPRRRTDSVSRRGGLPAAPAVPLALPLSLFFFSLAGPS